MTIDMAPDTNDGGALLGAAHWLEGLIHSPAMTAIAVLAVAGTGLSMLTGRLPIRRGLTVALGCFILFGSPAITRGIIGSAGAITGAQAAPALPQAELSAPAFKPPPPPAPPATADPYAGASVGR